MQHLINKQELILNIELELDAFRIQHFASQYYWQVILPVLERIFDRLSNEDEIIELDRFEIDLGRITEKNLTQKEWTGAMQSRLEQIVEELVKSFHNKIVVQKSNPLAGIYAQWLFYMQHGYLPWNVIEISKQWYNKVLEVLAGDFESVTILRRIISADASVSVRIVYQHQEEFLVHLVEILTAENQLELPVIIGELKELFIYYNRTQNLWKATTENEIRADLWKKILEFASIPQRNLTPAILAKHFITNFLPKNWGVSVVPAEIAIQWKTISPLIAARSDDLMRSQETRPDEPRGNDKPYGHDQESGFYSRVSKTEAERNIRDGNELDSEKLTGKDSEIKSGKKLLEPLTSEEQTQKGSDEVGDDQSGEKQLDVGNMSPGENSYISKDVKGENIKPDMEFLQATTKREASGFKLASDEGIFVFHAGIVLVHPFLTTLFSRLQLTQENKFTNYAARLKALQILYFAGTGKIEADEFELVIPKLLCNISLDEPVTAEILLSENERFETEDMLKAAILQWDKIRNTTVSALRESFLQRKGKLSLKNGNTHLQVESHAIDVLMDYLPWGLGIIKLPWMKDMLHVDWR